MNEKNAQKKEKKWSKCFAASGELPFFQMPLLVSVTNSLNNNCPFIRSDQLYRLDVVTAEDKTDWHRCVVRKKVKSSNSQKL